MLAAEPLDLIKLIGTFCEPSSIEMWEIYRTRFEKTAKQSNIPRVKWQCIIPNMLRGKAKVHVEAKGKD